jgi:hypothetical protein
MPFEYKWDNDDKTVVRYICGGVWKWNEFHRGVRVSHFAFDQNGHDKPIEAILDLSKSVKMPAGAVGHLRSLNKMDHAKRTGRIVIIGADSATQEQLGAKDGVFQTKDQLIRFVATDEEAQQILTDWLRNSPAKES